MTEFTLEVKGSTCAHIDDSIVADADRVATDTENLVKTYLTFKVSITHCNGQVISLVSTDLWYLETKKNVNAGKTIISVG